MSDEMPAAESAAAAPAPLVQQIVTSRFHVRAAFAGDRLQPRAWLEERLDLVARYTAVSLRAQTHTDFIWAIVCDPATPDDIVGALRALDPRVLVVAWCPGVTSIPESAQVHVAVNGLSPKWALRPDTGVLIETRLDTDDMLHRTYLADLQDMVTRFLDLGHPAWLVVAEAGFCCSIVPGSSVCSRLTTRRGPFQSLFTRIAPDVRLRTVYGHHQRMPDEFPTEYLRGRRRWLQVVHGGNVANRLPPRVQRADLVELAAGFDFVVG